MSDIDIQTAKEFLMGVKNGVKNEDSEIERLSKMVFDIAIQALEEKQKREQGCEYCRGVKPCAPHTDIITKGYNVCPMCGRRLSHE